MSENVRTTITTGIQRIVKKMTTKTEMSLIEGVRKLTPVKEGASMTLN